MEATSTIMEAGEVRTTETPTGASRAKYIALGVAIAVVLAFATYGYLVVTAEKIYQLSIHVEEEGNIAEAKKGYTKALRLNPWHANASYQLGVIMKKEGKVLEALKYMERAASLNEKEHDYQLGLGFLYFNDIGDVERAEKHFSRAYSLDSKSYFACYMLAKLNESKGNTKKAIEYYERAVAQNPNLAGAHKQLARIYDTQGMADEAKEHWENVLKLNPDDEDARAYLSIDL